VNNSSKENLDRTRRFAEDIHSISMEEGVGVVVGYIGSAHTPLGFRLKNMGMEVERSFPDMIGGVVSWLGANAATKQKELLFGVDLSELDWYRYLIINAIDSSNFTYLARLNTKLSKQQAINLFGKFNNRVKMQLTDMDDVLGLEGEIRESSFGRVIEDRFGRKDWFRRAIERERRRDLESG